MTDRNAPVTEDQLCAQIAQLSDVSEIIDKQIGRMVAMLRCYGRSWHYVSAVVGLTPEGARRKYEADCDLYGVPRRVTQDQVADLVAGLPPAASALKLQ